MKETKEKKMTKFDKSKFDYSAGWLTYEGKFVARFKYSGAPITKAQFVKELMKYSVEEYFEATRPGSLGSGESPVGFLDARNEGWSTRLCEEWKQKQLAKASARTQFNPHAKFNVV